MLRFIHITGAYTFDENGSLHKHHQFTPEEEKAFLHAKAIKDDAQIEAILAKAGISGDEPTAAQLTKILAHVRYQPIMRQANVDLTKQSIRESVKPDLLIINTSNGIEEIDKVANALVKRLREWYAIYDPELEHSYKDHRAFVEAVLSRTSDRVPETMGGSFSETDLEILLADAQMVHKLYEQRDQLLKYLELVMQQHTPNIKRIAGPTIGAKLLSMAGSLERLSRMPSSTIQLLGAETALFRHLRNNKARPPKHGIIFNHILLQRAPKPMRGKIARALADKISIGARVDYFKGEFIGDELYGQVEKRLQEA